MAVLPITDKLRRLAADLIAVATGVERRLFDEARHPLLAERAGTALLVAAFSVAAAFGGWWPPTVLLVATLFTSVQALDGSCWLFARFQ